ncbi:MAG: hypothetical protein JRI68_12470 [Deltaproteobacteria bacterium]|nr:hypothetical protein [Deltaproteobacteria bacterium]
MAKKPNWADVDKRIRSRKATWSQEDSKALEAGLKKLPDSEEHVEVLDLAQPALANDDEPEEGEGSAEDGAAESGSDEAAGKNS